MARLTRSGSGILDGYASTASRKDLVQKLGEIEHRALREAQRICDGYCKHREDAGELGLEFICESCPLTALMEMIG